MTRDRMAQEFIRMLNAAILKLSINKAVNPVSVLEEIRTEVLRKWPVCFEPEGGQHEAETESK
jgi:hypothetical protein